MGFSPLPVAPRQDPYEYPVVATAKGGGAYCPFDRDELERGHFAPKPRFNGKNPSYLDSNGKPVEVKHSHYRDKLPTEAELKEWFQDPRTGVGTNSGAWLDFDLKRFPSPAAMETAVAPIIEAAPWVERTQSGGYRVATDPEQKPDFQNFGIGDVDHAGEFLNGGGFVVLAPTVGEHGEYTRLKFGEPLKVGSLSELGIRPTKKAKAPAEATPPPVPTMAPTALRQGSPVSLTELASKAVKELMGDLGKDRSEGFAKVARELYGWENLAAAENIPLLDSADSILANIATDNSIETDRLERIVGTLNRGKAEPGLALAKGRDHAVNRLRKAAGLKVEVANDGGDIVLDDEDTAGRVAFRELYENQKYICIGGDFFVWVGTHYELRSQPSEMHRIANLLNRCVRVTESKNGITITRPFATARAVADAYTWCLRRVRNIELNDVNPGGLNLKNGVLIPDYSTDIPTFKLVPHNPNRVDTYCAPVSYDPLADTTEAERLLSAIPAEFRQTALRVKSAAIDLKAVRKKVGRDVRAMFWAGEGSNGKDAIRAACSAIFGYQGITSVSIRSFSIYDEGKQPWKLAPLLNSRINWPSENSAKESINKIESLKAVVAGTGEIDYERKNKDAEQFVPKCVCIFNTNDTQINLDHRSEAMASRYLIVPFPYRFTKNPQGPNDIKADPRFVYDEEWVQDFVCPGLLNLMLKEFSAIFSEGFDYSPFEAVMDKNLENSSHFYQFKAETNLIEDPTAITPISEIWQRLRSWYEDEEILRLDNNGRDIWNEDTRPGDKWIRTKEQLGQRIRKVFPNCEPKRNKSGRGIKGVRFASDCEIALRQVETYTDYCTVVELHGKGAVDTAWPYLGSELQSKITAMVPTTTTAHAAESKPTADNKTPLAEEPAESAYDGPLMEPEAQVLAEILVTAAATADTESLRDFKKLSVNQKQQVWALIPEPQKESVKTAMATLAAPDNFNSEDS